MMRLEYLDFDALGVHGGYGFVDQKFVKPPLLQNTFTAELGSATLFEFQILIEP